ncbi:MAG TPA: 4Fe-4S binding protein [Gammaproteobacteria bacterium]|nr:4Fe-4S binding protein [Gammaproteobacteria bacterium]
MTFAARILSIGGALLRALALAVLLASVSGAQPADDGAAPAGAAQGFDFDDADDAAPTFLDLASGQSLDVALFAAFATLVMVSFFRKSVRLRLVTLVASVLYMGFYKSQLLSIVNVFGTLSETLAAVRVGSFGGGLPPFVYSLAWYAFAIFSVVTTVLWGRIYCGRVCAFGALTQLIDAVMPARWRVTVPPALEQRASYIKYGILIAAVGYYLATRQITFYRYIEPFWMFTREGTTVLWIMLAVLLVASVFVRNLYCRFLCPLGAALGLLSTLTVFKIKRWNECSQCALCEKTCEWGAIRKRKIILKECVRCDDCERLYDDKTRCPHWLLEAKRKVRALVGAASAPR